MYTQIIVATMMALAASTTSPAVEHTENPAADNQPADEIQRTGWGRCAGYAVMAAVQCTVVFPLTCIASTVLTACECMPLILDEFEDYSCPGLG